MASPAGNCVVVCGPTASGKTALGVALALEFGGEILSADSRQVYRGMDIGTGKDLDEYDTPRGAVPYHLIDIRAPGEIYTLHHYQRDFYAAFRDIRARARLPVVVGGTGLYLEAVLRHYRIPNVPEDPELREGLMRADFGELLRRLRELDPGLYRSTDRSSKKRVVRALEIALYARGHEIEWSEENPPPIKPLVLAVRWPRHELRTRIDRRLEERLARGMIEEVERILQSGIRRDRFDLFGMEYRHVAAYLDGTVSRQEMVQNLRRAIHQLAKRQETWFRGMERRGIRLHWIDRADPGQAADIVRKGGIPLRPMEIGRTIILKEDS
jgi:tRNA dimethylallyltransferase